VVKLEHGPPSHDTFRRVLLLLAPEPFEAAFCAVYGKLRRVWWSQSSSASPAVDAAAVRARKDNAPRNLALIGKTALNTLRHPDKGSVKTKIKRPAWNDAFLAHRR